MSAKPNVDTYTVGYSCFLDRVHAVKECLCNWNIEIRLESSRIESEKIKRVDFGDKFINCCVGAIKSHNLQICLQILLNEKN